jgi:PiT family inorganic phosphate transporter
VLVVGTAYIGWSLSRDLVNLHVTSVLPYFLLSLPLFVALGFEFVNGFHDTAKAVASVIYTHTLDPHIAVVWSGFCNFLGVVSSTGIVAFGIISLLPVELILQVGSNAGFVMVFALLAAAILWNLGTWYFGLPAWSSHTLIGSIIGVGITNQLMSTRSRTSGVDCRPLRCTEAGAHFFALNYYLDFRFLFAILLRGRGNGKQALPAPLPSWLSRADSRLFIASR